MHPQRITRVMEELVRSWVREEFELLTKNHPVEHCSEPECPECNLKAYEKGREDMWKELLLTKK